MKNFRVFAIILSIAVLALPGVAQAGNDGDGWRNGVERTCGTDPNDAGSVPTDVDGDGICDELEDSDVDDDGFAAGLEVICGSDPLDAASLPTDNDVDGDLICDALDSDVDGDGWINEIETLCGDDPADAASTPDDNDGDGICDELEDADTDGDGWANAIETACGSDPADAAETPVDATRDMDSDGTCDSFDNDVDGDTWINDIETLCGDDPADAGSVPTDTDADGICDELENADADGDNWPNSIEVACGSDPLDAAETPDDATRDLDGDGLCDNFDNDKDDDGWINDTETLCGYDPADAGSVPADNDGDGICDELEDADTDGDGHANAVENICGSDPADAAETPVDATRDPDGDGVCSALDDDKDGDGTINAIETLCSSNPADAASTPSDNDGDGMCDALDDDIDGDTWFNAVELMCGDDPANAASVPDDTDADGICDELETSDIDGDGHANAVEDICASSASDALETPVDATRDPDGDGVCSALDNDKDGDGWLNQIETVCGDDPADAASVPSDNDGDGICDELENADTDGDGFPNAVEDICGSDKTDAVETPVDATRDIDGDGICNVLDNDQDADGWINDIETLCLTDPADGASTPTDDDADGICDALEDYGMPTITGVSITQGATTANPITVNEGTTVTIKVTATDPENDDLDYLYTQVSGPTVDLPGGDGTNSLDVDLPVLEADDQIVIRVTVLDERGISSLPMTATINVTANNQQPTAVIDGNLIVGEGETVLLSAADSSDPDGHALSYAWTLTDNGGGACSLVAATTMETTVNTSNVDADTTCTVRLVVNDGITDSVAVTSDIVVLNTVNTPPWVRAIQLRVDGGANTAYLMPALAGPHIMNEGERVRVRVQGRDADNDARTYRYTQIAGPSIDIPAEDDRVIFITMPEMEGTAAETVIVRVEVVDDNGTLGTPGFAVFDVRQINRTPTADAGPDHTVNEGDNVMLDGVLSSDPDSDGLTYTWRQVDANPQLAEFGGGTLNGQRVSFVAPATITEDTTYTFELTVDDGRGGSDTDQVDVEVRNSTNAVPTVVLGNQTVGEGDSVTVTAVVTEPDLVAGGEEQDMYTSTWVQVAGTPVTFTVNPLDQDEISFTAPTVFAEDDIVFTLTVSDGRGGVVVSTSTITVQNDVNEVPVANAGVDRTVSEQTTVILDGSLSRDDNDPSKDNMTFAWTQTAGPAVTIDAANAPIAHFMSPKAVAAGTTLTFQLAVADGDGGNDTDAVVVTITDDINELPVVDAGDDVETGEQQNVALTVTATDENEADLSNLTYAWVQLEGPEVTLSGAATPVVAFTTPVVDRNAEIVLAVTVTDSRGGSSSDQVSVFVKDLYMTCVSQTFTINNGDDVEIECTAQTGEDKAAIFYAVTSMDSYGIGEIINKSETPAPVDFNITTDGNSEFDVSAPAAIDFAMAAAPASMSYDVSTTNGAAELTLDMDENKQSTYEARQTWIRKATLHTLSSVDHVTYTVLATAVTEYGSIETRTITVTSQPASSFTGGSSGTSCHCVPGHVDHLPFGAKVVLAVIALVLGSLYLIRQRQRS